GRLFEGHRRGDLEGDLRRIDLMVRTIKESDLHVHHRVAGQGTRFHRVAHAALDRRNVLSGNYAALGVVIELEPFTRRHRLDTEDDVAILAAPTGLTDELAFLLHGAPNGFLVGDLGLADVRIHLELAQQPVDDDLEVQLSHSRDDGLTGFAI